MAEAPKEPGEESEEQAKEMIRISRLMDGSMYEMAKTPKDFEDIRQLCEELYECPTKSNTYSIGKLGLNGRKMGPKLQLLVRFERTKLELLVQKIIMIVSEDKGSAGEYEIVVFQDSVLSIAYVTRDIIKGTYRYILEGEALSNISFCKFYERYGYDITQTLFEKIGYEKVRDELGKLLK
jgi:hypothetical protein